MAQEIERKFLLKNQNWKAFSDSGTEIKQGYLSTEKERTVRIRIRGDKGILTIKGATVGMSRLEFEYEIPIFDARELILLCKKPIIEKTRFLLKADELTWEIDIFSGENKGLEIAEVELNTENQTVNLPDWIGEEVTSDSRYYNSNLVKNPFKNWKD